MPASYTFDTGGACDQQGWTVARRLTRESFNGRPAAGLKCGFENQVFRRIARDEQLREDDDVGTLGGRARARGASLLDVADNIANRRVELRNSD